MEEPLIGPRAPFSVVEFEPPVDQLDEQYPIRLTTGRRLDDYNTGVQTREVCVAAAAQRSAGGFSRRWAALQVARGRTTSASPRAADRSWRPCVSIPRCVRAWRSYRSTPTTRYATNDLTIDAVDPKSGTAEFKATAIRMEKV